MIRNNRVSYDEALRVIHFFVNLISPTSKEQDAFSMLRLLMEENGESPKAIIQSMLNCALDGLSKDNWPKEDNIK